MLHAEPFLKKGIKAADHASVHILKPWQQAAILVAGAQSSPESIASKVAGILEERGGSLGEGRESRSGGPEPKGWWWFWVRGPGSGPGTWGPSPKDRGSDGPGLADRGSEDQGVLLNKEGGVCQTGSGIRGSLKPGPAVRFHPWRGLQVRDRGCPQGLSGGGGSPIPNSEV
jgi:hypothetical protein